MDLRDLRGFKVSLLSRGKSSPGSGANGISGNHRRSSLETLSGPRKRPSRGSQTGQGWLLNQALPKEGAGMSRTGRMAGAR